MKILNYALGLGLISACAHKAETTTNAQNSEPEVVRDVAQVDVGDGEVPRLDKVNLELKCDVFGGNRTVYDTSLIIEHENDMAYLTYEFENKIPVDSKFHKSQQFNSSSKSWETRIQIVPVSKNVFKLNYAAYDYREKTLEQQNSKTIRILSEDGHVRIDRKLTPNVFSNRNNEVTLCIPRK